MSQQQANRKKSESIDISHSAQVNQSDVKMQANSMLHSDYRWMAKPRNWTVGAGRELISG